MTLEVFSFGCRLNGVESETMRERAEAAGLSDLVVVNTCAVTQEAVRQAGQAIRRAARARPDAQIVVTGCAAEIDPVRFGSMPGVTALLGNAVKTRPQFWARLAGGASEEPPGAASGVLEAASDSGAGRVRTFVQVQTGCDHRCTFCVIPFGRGASRSVPAAEIVASVRAALERGAREIVLTGVDLTAYGGDLTEGIGLGRLVKTILREVPDLPRLRLSSIDSVEVDRDLLDAIAHEPRLMPHLHLSLQSGDDLVLKRMKRRHSRSDALALCRHVRRLRPGVAFGADLIAGFPTETEDMFARSLDLVEECGLAHLHVFPFSARPGTPAARMPPSPADVVRHRAARLRSAGAAALGRHLEAQAGRVLRVLAETPTLGRAEDFTPVRFATAIARGELRDVAPSAHDGRELLAP